MQALEEIRALILRHAKAGDGATSLANVRLRKSEAVTWPINSVCEPAFALVAQGKKRTALGDMAFEYGSGHYLIASVDLPVVGGVVRATRAEPYLGFVMTLNPATIATLMLEIASDDRRAGEPLGLAVSRASPDLLDAVARVLRLLSRPKDVAVLAPMLEREILWRLLTGEQGAMLRQIGLAGSRLSQIRRAIHWIRVHYSEPLATTELAQVVGMSDSSFHRHFRAVTSMSPLQYQKRIRLQEARSRLLADAGVIASVGYDVGYESPSQFSREYSRLFGVPPGKDMARLRGMSQVDRSAT
ncbi:AraC family transcriptional regulator N-terminal domain-containing protein [Dyella soli]|nr:AraC family transcriptional regulator [Dyella soli]